MHSNAITQALKRIIKSQRKVHAIAHSLSNHIQVVLESGNVTEAYELKKELINIERIVDQLGKHFQELELVHVSRMKRAEAYKERWQVIN